MIRYRSLKYIKSVDRLYLERLADRSLIDFPNNRYGKKEFLSLDSLSGPQILGFILSREDKSSQLLSRKITSVSLKSYLNVYIFLILMEKFGIDRVKEAISYTSRLESRRARDEMDRVHMLIETDKLLESFLA